MHKLRTGIVGCGKVTDLHAKALLNTTHSDFRALCSRSQAKGDRYAAKYGVTAYADLEAMIRRESLDVLVICTPHPAHREATVLAAALGVHVLVEKPLASSLADCDAMIEACRTAHVKLGMVSQRRLYAPCQRMKQAIDAGKIGTPVLGTATLLGWRDQAYYDSDPWRGTWQEEGGGVLVNQAPHQLDLLQWYMGPIQELFGYWDNLNHPCIEVEDTAVAVLRFKNGGLGNLILSNSQDPALYGKVLVHGSSGATVGVQTDGGAMFIAGMSDIEEAPINDHWTIPGEQDRLRTWQEEDTRLFNQVNAMEYYHQCQVEDFLEAVLNDRDPLVTGSEGRKTVEIFTALYRSQRDCRPVTFPLVPEQGRTDYDGRLA
ncbi:MAG: Gfo/Idh/MocA family oxidoreductase [Phycisphaerae bacterium]|nr:Gfo/Idh/MocA family oxidoreductase [Phycisphaerae bacterium]